MRRDLRLVMVVTYLDWLGALDHHLMEVRSIQSINNDDQVTRRALEILHAEAMRPMPEVKANGGLPSPTSSPAYVFEGERVFPLGSKDLIYSKENWFSKPLTYCSSAVWAGSFAGSPVVTRFGGGGAAAILGLTSAVSDARDLWLSDRPIEGLKYFGAVVADLSVTVGGIKMMTSCAPRWLAPGLVLGGMIARAGCDAIPNNILNRYDENRDIKTVVQGRDISNEFAERIEKVYMRDIPEHVRQRMEREGYTVRVTPYLTHPEGYPELVGKRPRGWSEGNTWNDAEGTVRGERKQVLIAQNRVVKNTLVPSDRVDGVFRHEYGHAVNKVFGSRGELFSDGAEFQVAYERDVSKLSGVQCSEIQYLLQPGSAGRDECFADVFAALIGGPCNGVSRRVLDPFPEVASLINRKILRRN